MTASHHHHHLDVAGVDTFVYDQGEGAMPLVCVHGNPDSADMWLPMLERSGDLGRVVAADLPGFGRSARPSPAAFDSSVRAYADWFEALLDAAAIDRYRLAVHDWGSVGLAGALRRPERVEALVALDIVPLNATYHWHWIARWLWRPPIIGEVGMVALSRFTIDLLTRLQRPGFRSLDGAWLDRVGRDLDGGMKDAILRLYRSANPDVLGAAGANLGRLACPALILWGEQDPYVPVEEARKLAHSLGGPAEVRTFTGGHWLGLDRPAVFDDITAWLVAAG
ncbi:MAG: alpha/beta fold hydrolase [Acidimicrobiales bacterium]